MKIRIRKGIGLFSALLMIVTLSGCSDTIPPDAGVINVNKAIARQSGDTIADSNTGTKELPISTWSFRALTEAYPSAVFVNTDGRIILQAEDVPYSTNQDEYCYLGPLRMSPYYQGTFFVEKLETDQYVEGLKLSWRKSMQLKSAEVLPIPSMQLEEPIPIDTELPISTYFLAFVYLDKNTNQYAVLKDTNGSAKGIWMVQ